MLITKYFFVQNMLGAGAVEFGAAAIWCGSATLLGTAAFAVVYKYFGHSKRVLAGFYVQNWMDSWISHSEGALFQDIAKINAQIST
jgi:hypothetical protein